MKQSSIFIGLFFILLVVTTCNKQEPNEPPQPCITGPWYEGNVGSGDYLESNFNSPLTLSANCSTDADSDTLTARWDWTADGIWDTYFISIHAIVNNQYPDTGWYELVLSVDDGKEAKLKSAMVHIK